MRRLILFFLVLLPLGGCVQVSEMRSLRNDIAEETGTRFDTGVSLSLGSSLTQSASWITGRVDDSDAHLVSQALEGVRRMRGAVYPIDRAGDLDALDPRDLPHFSRGGWQIALKTIDSDDTSWVFYRERRGSVYDLYTVVLTDSELVLVRLQGHLNALLDLAMEEAEGNGTTIVDLDY